MHNYTLGQKEKNQAQEVAYIAIRIAQFCKDKDIAQRIHSHAHSLIEKLYSDALQESQKNVAAIQGLIALAANTGSVSLENADIWSQKATDYKELIEEGQKEKQQEFLKIQQRLKSIQAPKKKKAKESRQGKDTNKRQENLIKAIKEGNNLELKNLVRIFPDISERTIRYDLTQLTQRGKITRHGAGGPGNYYTAN